MRFRGIKEFNIALHSKPAGNIMINPSILVAKILKARSFLNSYFLEASRRTNPFFLYGVACMRLVISFVEAASGGWGMAVQSQFGTTNDFLIVLMQQWILPLSLYGKCNNGLPFEE